MLNQSTDYQNVCIARPLLPNLRTKYRYRYLPVWPFRGARGESRHRHAVPPQIIAGSLLLYDMLRSATWHEGGLGPIMAPIMVTSRCQRQQ